MAACDIKVGYASDIPIEGSCRPQYLSHFSAHELVVSSTAEIIYGHQRKIWLTSTVYQAAKVSTIEIEQLLDALVIYRQCLSK